MAQRKAVKKRKALPSWVSALVIIVVLVGIGVIYTLKQSGDGGQAKLDPGWNAAKANWYTKIQNPSYVKILSAAKRSQLAADGEIPEAWAQNPPDFNIPYEQAKKAAELKQFAEKYGKQE